MIVMGARRLWQWVWTGFDIDPVEWITVGVRFSLLLLAVTGLAG